MRLFSVDELTPGMVIAKSIYDDSYRLLVGRGVALVDSMIQRLKAYGFYQVYIEEPGTEDVLPPEMISDKVRQQASRILNRSFEKITSVSEIKDVTVQDVNKLLDEGTQYGKVINVGDFKTLVTDIIDDLITNNTTAFEAPLFRGYLGRQYEHALNATILSLLIGRQYRYDRKEMGVLGTGGLMHDIGKMVVPSILDKKPEDLDEKERELAVQHPLLGGKLLKEYTQASFTEIACVEQHHEYQDGSGYPYKLTGTNTEPLKNRTRPPGHIFRMAEILVVANTFDNLMDPNITDPPLSPMDAVEKIITMAGKELNAHVVGNAINIINIFPVGATVRITEHPSEDMIGATGVVFKGNVNFPDRPWIVMLYSRKGQRFQEQVKINLLEKKHIKVRLQLRNR